MTLSEQLKPELDAVVHEVHTSQRESGVASPELWQRYEGVLRRVNDAVGLDVLRDAATIYQGDFVLKRAQADPITLTVVYTQDGLPIEDPIMWHDGSPDEETVYYEKYNLQTGARLTHGWVDKSSRKLTQSG